MSRYTVPAPVCFIALAAVFPLAGVAAANDVVVLPVVSAVDQTAAGTAGTSVTATAAGPSTSGAFGDLAHQTAGFSFNDAGARGFGTTATLRGLGNTPFFSDASAPVYLDDIPLATAFTFPSELYDFSRMTVYRGPQAAALFGRAGDAGVIQFTSTPAGARENAQFAASAGDYNEFSATASAQTARSAEFDASASVGTSRRDGYITNTQLHQTVDNRSAVFGRTQLHYRPAPDLELSLQLLAEQSRDGAEALVPLGGPYYSVSRGKEGETDADFTALSVGVTKHLADATLTATTSYTNWDLSPYSNRLVVFGGANFDSYLTQSQRAFNEELRFVSGLFTGGAFYSHYRTEGATSRSFNGFTIENSRFDLTSDTFALFGRATFKPAAGWEITPGLRLERTAKDLNRIEAVPANRVYQADDSWNALLPSVVATRHLDATTDATFTVSRGFKAGGYSAYTSRADLAGYDPQRTWGAEAAVSTSDAKSGWAFTARGYAYRISGYQIERSFAVPNTGTDEYLVVNAKRARSLGLEIESTWQPVADLTVRAIGGLTEVTLQDFTDPFTGANYSGSRAPYAPSGNAALRIDYAPARGFLAGAGVTWTGRTFYDEHETALFSQPAYTLFDAHVGFAFARGDVRVFGRNLGDKAYYSAITPGVGHATPGAPLTWGVETNCRW